MIRNELKVKYKNSVLGFAWSLLNPLLYLVVFYIAFTIILRSGIPAFPIYLLSGLLVWNLFSTGLGGATGSVVGNAGLVKKVVVPARDPAHRRGRQHARALLPAELGAVHRARHRALARRVGVHPAHPVRAGSRCCSSPARWASCSPRSTCTCATRQHFLELALLAWFWVTPIVYAFHDDANRRHGGWFKTSGWRTRSRRSCSIVPTRDLRQARQPEDRPPVIRSPAAAALAVLGATSRISGTRSCSAWIFLAIAIRVFGRSEANFAEEL